MDTKEKVVQAQRKIIDGLANCEEAISRLYALYGEADPASKKFWLELSEKEEIHASLLRTMHKQLDKGELFRNIGRFNVESIELFLQEINDAIRLVKENAVSPMLAIQTSLQIESSVLDAHFYDIVESDNQEYRAVADTLSVDTTSHVKSVQKKLKQMQSAGSAPE